MAFENKFGKSAVDAARNNALPPYLDVLLKNQGIGGSEVKIINLVLPVSDWIETKEGGVTLYADIEVIKNDYYISNETQLVFLSAEGIGDENYPVAAAGIEFKNAVCNPIYNDFRQIIGFTSIFYFSAAKKPLQDVAASILCITPSNSTEQTLADALTKVGTINTTVDGADSLYSVQTLYAHRPQVSIFTVPNASWSSSSVSGIGTVWSATVSVPYVMSIDTPFVQGVNLTTTNKIQTWGAVYEVQTSAKSVILKSIAAPTANINIQVAVIK